MCNSPKGMLAHPVDSGRGQGNKKLLQSENILTERGNWVYVGIRG